MLTAQQRENMQCRVWDPRDARGVCIPPPGRHLRSSCPSSLQDHTRSVPWPLALLKASASLSGYSALACFVARTTRQLPVGLFDLFGWPIRNSILDFLVLSRAATPPPAHPAPHTTATKQFWETVPGEHLEHSFSNAPKAGKILELFSVVFLELGF